MQQPEELKILDEKLIRKFNTISKNKIDYWDIRASIKHGSSIEFTDMKSKEVSSFETSKCGIRTFYNGGWGFVVLEDFSRNLLERNFKKAVKLAKLTESFNKQKFSMREKIPIQESYELHSKQPLEDIDISEKIEIVKHHEKIANDFSDHIKNTHTLYFDGTGVSLYLDSYGSMISQKLSILRMFSAIFAQKNGIIQRGFNSVGGLGGLEILGTPKAENLSKKSAKDAVDLLDAESPVGGKFTLIMDPSLTGTFIHEAFGHACEADLVLNKESILEGKIGQQVAVEDVTVIDDPRMEAGKNLGLPYELYGSYFIDDEGIPSQKTTIIEDGIFKNYLHNLETSSRMDQEPNGHGRASSSTSKPQVRMGITMLEPKDWTLEEMIADTKNGILCEDFNYGYTDPTTGNFQFKAKLSYRIENGEKKELMRDVALSGMTLEVLNRISAIGKELKFSDGNCGKGGQSVRVSDGGPYIRIDDIVVGGLK